MRIPVELKSDSNLAIAGTLLILAVVVLQRFPGERFWLTLLFTYIPQQIWLIPPVFITVFMLLHHKWWLAAGSIVPVFLVLLLLMGAPVPKSAPKLQSQLRVLTWNLFYGKGGPSLDELYIQTMPDIICLQEANPWAGKSLDKTLDLPQFKGWHASVCGELVILSRFPLKRLGTTHSALWVAADVDGKEVVIVDVHFAVPFKPKLSNMTPDKIRAADDLRMMQTKEVLEGIPAGRPTIVCGDFNTPPNTRIYRMLGSRMKNSFQSAGKGIGLSYKREFPIVRIDHIFSKGSLEPVRCWMPKINASNHRPVCADFMIY